MTQISFPNLFDGIISINPVAIPFGNGGIRWYGLIICFGIIMGVIVALHLSKKEGISSDDLLDFVIYAIPFSIIGARLYYVLTSGGSYESFIDVIAVWRGGIAIYGAVIGGALTVFIVSKIKKIPFFKIADVCCPALLLGQGIGRWGNFCNGEAFGHLDRIEFLGKSVATPFFDKDYFLAMSVKSEASGNIWLSCHPTFLYESVWSIIGVILLLTLYRKKHFTGQITLSYLAWYGLGRFFIEGLRADSLMLFGTNVRVSQLLALITFIVSLAIIIYVNLKNKNIYKEN